MPILDMTIEHVKIPETIDSLENITNKIKFMSISKASGTDGINARILRETADQLANSIKNQVRKKFRWRYTTIPMERSTCICHFQRKEPKGMQIIMAWLVLHQYAINYLKKLSGMT